jgi:dihydrodipicolinate synthase/N-acetylneuraminate lyase
VKYELTIIKLDNMNTNFEGLIAATFTPIGNDRSVQTKLIVPVVEHLIAQNVSGIFVCGSTGEGFSLSTSERKEATEAFLEASNGRLKETLEGYCFPNGKQWK